MTPIQHTITTLEQLNATLDEAFADGWIPVSIRRTMTYRECSVQAGPQRHGSIYLNHPEWHFDVPTRGSPEIRLLIAPWVLKQMRARQ